MSKQTKQLIVLILLLVLVAVVCVRQYLPGFQLPTQGTLDQKTKQLRQLQSDLDFARQKLELRNHDLLEMQALTIPYWIPDPNGMKPDQLINLAVSNLLRRSQISGTQKVDLQREKPGSIFQEVTVSLDFRNVTMRDLSDFFHSLRASANGPKFRWDNCKITPDNPRAPKAVNASLRFKVLVLSADTIAYLNGESPADKAPAAKDAGKGGAARGNGAARNGAARGNGASRR